MFTLELLSHEDQWNTLEMWDMDLKKFRVKFFYSFNEADNYGKLLVSEGFDKDYRVNFPRPLSFEIEVPTNA